MGDKVNFQTILSGYQSALDHKANWDSLTDILDDKLLWRDNPTGTANSMQNDLDMNSNSVLNADVLSTDALLIDGVPVTSAELPVAPTRRFEIEYTDGIDGLGITGTNLEERFGITLTAGDLFYANSLNANKTASSDAPWRFTGVTDVGNAGLIAGGYVHDATGKQLENVSQVRNLAQFGLDIDQATADGKGLQINLTEPQEDGVFNSPIDLQGRAISGGGGESLNYPLKSMLRTTADQAAMQAARTNRYGQHLHDMRLDGTGIASSELGVVISVSYEGIYENVYITDTATPCGFYLASENENGDTFDSGFNLLFNRLFNCRAQSVPYDASATVNAQFHLGEADNGKMTDGTVENCSGSGGSVGLYIGSAQGWKIENFQTTNMDDGVQLPRIGRTTINGLIVDGFGVANDNTRDAYSGVIAGSTTTAGRGLNLSNFLIECGNTDTTNADSDPISYYGVRFKGGTASDGILHSYSDGSIILDAASGTYAFYQDNDTNDDVIGAIKGVTAWSANGADEAVEEFYGGTRSPYLLVKDNVNGKRKTREHHNDYGYINKLNDGTNYFESEIKGIKTNMSSGVATTIARASFDSVPASMTFEVTVNLNPSSNVGYVSRGTKFFFTLQKHSSGSAVKASTVVTSGEDTVISNSAGVRNIATPVLSLSISGADVDIQVAGTISGSAGETEVDCVYKIQALGRANATGFDLVQQ